MWMMRGRRGEVYTHIGAPTGHAGERPAQGILPGVDQEYIGHSPKECVLGGRVITRDGTKYCDGESVPWRVHWGWSCGEDLDWRESRGMVGVHKDPLGGIPQAPTVRLFRTAEVTLAGVIIHAAGHPWHSRRLWPGRESAAGHFLVGFL